MDEQVTGARKENSSESLVWEGSPTSRPGPLCSEGLGLDFFFLFFILAFKAGVVGQPPGSVP